jgi:hypothetical protein
MIPEERRIYVAVAASIQVPVVPGSYKPPLRTVVQPPGRQFAQGCHVVSQLRINMHNGSTQEGFEPITTIILQARDSAELSHVSLLAFHKRLNPEAFLDNNPEYGPGNWPTAVAVFATPKQVKGILDYLPLWGSK